MNASLYPRRKPIHGGQKVANAITTAALYLPAWGFLFAIIGGIVWYNTRSSSAFWWIFLLGPPSAHFFFQARRFRQFEKVFDLLTDAALEAFDKVDYYEAGFVNSIAVDVTQAEFAICRPVSLTEPPKTTYLPLEMIVSVRAFSPAQQTFYTPSTASYSTKSEAASLNIKSHDDTLRATGLYLYCDDVAMDQVFVQMSYRSAERWLRLIEKMRDGTLKPTSKPIDMFSVGGA